jgi:Pyruvate/2-oxoacid:ferredoxin oxidoreductase delta subunit
MTVVDVYRSLQEHLHKMPVGFPATQTGVELNLLKAIFTPEQAKLAIHLGYKHKTVKQIFAAATGEVDSPEQLELVLDEIVSKGGITRRKRDGNKEYALLPLLLWGMYEHQLKRLSPDFLMNLGQYLQQEFGYEIAASPLPKMRVIPIEESVEAKHSVATYDELQQLIEQAGEHIAIQDCICRKVADLQGNACDATERREVCMSFGDMADLYSKEGWGRKISKQEALDIARKNEEDGLVLMPGNAQEAAFMCACCGDCCGMLSMMKNFPRPADVVASNYYAQVVAELCSGCETCVQRCPLDAISMEGTLAVIDLARCIGCGVCVPSCSEKSLHLVKKDREAVPPETLERYYDTIMAGKSSARSNQQSV